MATNKQTITKEMLENLGIISINIEKKEITRWNKRNTKQIVTKMTPSEQHNSKVNANKVSYKHYICCIRGKTYSFSNLVYAWFVGPIPSGFLIDHINGNTDDNRPDNLRLYTQ